VRRAQRFHEEDRILTEDLTRALDLRTYVQDNYRQAVAGVQRLDSESDFEYRMRQISHLHLTRYVRLLLDRKDRLSMAVGLEVRVPYCDHRLVEYVYNAPWHLKSFDGREKSLLREATADLLPRSVYDRVKSPYPSTQDPAYVVALQTQAKELLGTPSHQVFDLISRDRLARAAGTDMPQISHESRRALETALNLAVWIDLYSPHLTHS
jgi:asparagine synthase (glutamine-hydrolysing)